MISAYRIGVVRGNAKVWLVRTDTVAEPTVPSILPLSSVMLSFDEARALAEQILAAIPEQVPA